MGSEFSGWQNFFFHAIILSLPPYTRDFVNFAAYIWLITLLQALFKFKFSNSVITPPPLGDTCIDNYTVPLQIRSIYTKGHTRLKVTVNLSNQSRILHKFALHLCNDAFIQFLCWTTAPQAHWKHCHFYYNFYLINSMIPGKTVFKYRVFPLRSYFAFYFQRA